MPCCDSPEIRWTPVRMSHCRFIEMITQIDTISRMHASFWRLDAFDFNWTLFVIRLNTMMIVRHLVALLTACRSCVDSTFTTVLSFGGVIIYITDFQIVFFLLCFWVRCERLITFNCALSVFSHLLLFYILMLLSNMFHLPITHPVLEPFPGFHMAPPPKKMGAI